MTQPPASSARRTRRLIVRLNDEQQALIRDHATKAGLSVSEYVRRVAVSGHVIVRQQSAYAGVIARELRAIGVNVNQLTRRANIHDEMPPELAHVCEQLRTILDRVLRMD